MKYYRTYIFEFRLSGGVFYYAGKRVSTHKYPNTDPYTGSGNVIKAAFKKYGHSMFISKTWFDHSSMEEMNNSEITLIDNYKTMYGLRLTNIAKGGQCGYLYEYASKEDKLLRNERIRKSNSGKIFSKSHRENISKSKSGKKLAPLSDEHKINISKSGKIAQNRPETKKKRTMSLRLSRRSSTVWRDPLYTKLYSEWSNALDKNGNRLKCRKFVNHLSSTGIHDCTDSDMRKLIVHFNNVIDGNEIAHTQLIDASQ